MTSDPKFKWPITDHATLESAPAQLERYRKALEWIANAYYNDLTRTLHIDMQGKAKEALDGPA